MTCRHAGKNPRAPLHHGESLKRGRNRIAKRDWRNVAVKRFQASLNFCRRHPANPAGFSVSTATSKRRSETRNCGISVSRIAVFKYLIIISDRRVLESGCSAKGGNFGFPCFQRFRCSSVFPSKPEGWFGSAVHLLTSHLRTPFLGFSVFPRMENNLSFVTRHSSLVTQVDANDRRQPEKESRFPLRRSCVDPDVIGQR